MTGTLIERSTAGTVHVAPGQLDLARFEAQLAQALATEDATSRPDADEAVACGAEPVGNVESEELHARVPRWRAVPARQEAAIDATLAAGPDGPS